MTTDVATVKTMLLLKLLGGVLALTLLAVGMATGRMGSVVYADALAGDGGAAQLMLSLEMIGYFSDAPGSQQYPLPLLRLFYPSTGNFIALVEWQPAGDVYQHRRRTRFAL